MKAQVIRQKGISKWMASFLIDVILLKSQLRRFIKCIEGEPRRNKLSTKKRVFYIKNLKFWNGSSKKKMKRSCLCSVEIKKSKESTVC